MALARGYRYVLPILFVASSAAATGKNCEYGGDFVWTVITMMIDGKRPETAENATCDKVVNLERKSKWRHYGF